MMVLSSEVRAVQNPALGALLIWRAMVGFERANGKGAPSPLPLLFLVLPILLHDETEKLVSGTMKGSGLRKFAEKFCGVQAKTDLMLAIQGRAIRMRRLTLQALAAAIASGLISLDHSTGLAFPLSMTSPKAGIADSIQDLVASAEKLGYWFGELTLHEIGLVLRVSF